MDSIHNLAYLESLYASYQGDAQSVSAAWREHFRNGHDRGSPAPRSRPRLRGAETPSRSEAANSFSDRLNELIRNYRLSGHLIAQLDPLGTGRPCPPELDLEFYGFAENELESLTNCAALPYDSPLTVREIFQRLRDTYCRFIGVQFMHLEDLAVRQWLQHRMESSQNRVRLTRPEQLRILTRLTDAVIFEEFLRKKFLGAKTFSLEGSETLLPFLDLVIEKAARQGIRDLVLGMGHRGRLNVLAHVAGKPPSQIFREFADAEPTLWLGRGDVKYHLGHSHDWKTADGQRIHVSLCFNPSHLEFINPLVLGRVRARQDRLGDRDRRQVLGILIHGDAAFAGEGIVQESLNLSKLAGYFVGGVLHVVVNNQMGFTTGPGEGRSTTYATDVARMLQAPIFHVNGECAEAAAQVARLAMDFRHEFQTDVFVDLHGYRRRGHSETDDPSFTQPLLYRAIDHRPTVREAYVRDLLEQGGVTAEEAEEIARGRRAKLEDELAATKQGARDLPSEYRGRWSHYLGGPEPADEPDTGVSREQLVTLLRKLTEVPDGFHLHPKLERGLKHRREMAEGRAALDWSAAEALAFATLATEGTRVRLTGQDSARGTFSQRHAIFHDQQDDSLHVPLQHLTPDQATIEIHNSPLSEAGVLGFEYGFSLDCPDGLILWEAQFGDFVNAAQVILDQFLSSAEDKWRRLSGLVLLLPHGFEGLGPEHSSARVERFLTLAAEDNIQIVQPTSPAQYFHVLRRQAKRLWRKPLVIFTPKSLLRHPAAVSTLEECAEGRFQRLLPEARPNAQRVLLCTGKVFYELAAHREQHQHGEVALVRLEQLYPLRADQLSQALEPYADNVPVFWVQEEPANMGAWRYLHERFGRKLLGRFPFDLVSRPESASPATGSTAAHKVEQAQLIARAFATQEPMPADSTPTPSAGAPEAS
jgi:2-oxoglutarate dehydrogenase E1 component